MKTDEEACCIGRNYYGPYEWNFVFENIASITEEKSPCH